MDYRPLLAQHTVQLSHDAPRWDDAAQIAGLDPYVCKASYVCGVMREFMQASGLNFEHNYHLGSLFLALDATELLGRIVSGKRGTDGSTEVLRTGVRYLEGHADPQARPLPHSAVQYVKLRNFAGHGAAQLTRTVAFTPDSTQLLLRHLAYVLNTMWEDPSLSANLAAAEIYPLFTVVKGSRQPVYVRDIQEHLMTSQPADGLEHDCWRYDEAAILDNSSPSPSGTA
ncbi:hypothetical protein [Streptomyces odonnellii]|jgi:hypothetical protein|uniref:hypothetical protein n=1 Tax=Streptomyces odonnellii TaxID=1417980 RepID=UPI000625A362|nr:hypothetical protein [Streptomyces odonnellii]